MYEQIDKQIISECKIRNLNSFRKLVEFYQKYAYSIAFRILQNTEDTKDVVQESFIRVWQHIENYNENIKFSTWLFKIVTNLCLDKLKISAKKSAQPLGKESNLKKTESSEITIINNDLKEKIISIAEKLPPLQKIIFVLRDIQEMEIDEIEIIVKLSANQIKSNLYYARKNIRETLESQGYLK